jgi:hypothetical protein
MDEKLRLRLHVCKTQTEPVGRNKKDRTGRFCLYAKRHAKSMIDPRYE